MVLRATLTIALLTVCSNALTCYNGMKALSMQSVGESAEQCPSGSMCYNMTAHTGIVVDLVKAGCSSYRCMLARDTCISLTINFVPVSLCCCSTDRCNVAGNPQFADNTGSSGSSSGDPVDVQWTGGSQNQNRKSSAKFTVTPSPVRSHKFADEFKNFDVDSRSGTDNVEEEMVVQWRTTTPSTRAGRVGGASKTSTNNRGSNVPGREIEI